MIAIIVGSLGTIQENLGKKRIVPDYSTIEISLKY